MTERAERLASRAVVAVQTFWLTPCAPDFAVALRFALVALGLVQLALRWSIVASQIAGRTDSLAVAGYALGLVGVAVGYRTRLFAALAWLGHGAVLGGARSLDLGDAPGDAVMQLLLCYLVFSPAGARWSVDAWLGRVSAAPTAVARIAQRALQIHLCLLYIDAGLDKAQDPAWWSLIGAIVVSIELGFVAMIWIAATRRAALVAATVIQLSAAVATHQWLCGLTMIAFLLVAFGPYRVRGARSWPLLCLSGLGHRAMAPDDAKHHRPETRCVVLPCSGRDRAPRSCR